MAQSWSERVRGTFTENFSLKVLSLVFALLLYSLVHGAQEAQRSLSVSLEVLPPPESANRVLVSQIPPQVRVTIRGARTVVDDQLPMLRQPWWFGYGADSALRVDAYLRLTHGRSMLTKLSGIAGTIRMVLFPSRPL